MAEPPAPQLPPQYPSPLPPEVEGAATTAMWIEIIFGLFSLLGLGHIYSGRIPLGLGLLIGWWVFIVLGAGLTSLTAGLAACLLVPLYFVVPIVSGVQASTYVKKARVTGSWKSVGIVGGSGCVFLAAAATCAFVAFGITLSALFSGAASSQQGFQSPDGPQAVNAEETEAALDEAYATSCRQHNGYVDDGYCVADYPGWPAQPVTINWDGTWDFMQADVNRQDCEIASQDAALAAEEGYPWSNLPQYHTDTGVCVPGSP